MTKRFRKTFEKFDGLQTYAAKRIGTRRRKSAANSVLEDHHVYWFLSFERAVDGSYSVLYLAFFALDRIIRIINICIKLQYNCSCVPVFIH